MKTNTMEFIKENFEAEELTKNLNTMIWYNEYLDLGIDGAFDFGMRGNDHNILTSCLNEDNETNLKNLHNNGWFRIVPETCTVLIAQGQELPEELEALGYDVEVYL